MTFNDFASSLWLPVLMVLLLGVLAAMWWLYERLNPLRSIKTLAEMKSWVLHIAAGKGQRHPAYTLKGWAGDDEWRLEASAGTQTKGVREVAGCTQWQISVPGPAFVLQPAGEMMPDMQEMAQTGLGGYVAHAQHPDHAQPLLEALQGPLADWNAKHGSDRALLVRVSQSGIELRLPYYEKDIKHVQRLVAMGLTLARVLRQEE